jgi:antitoxin VapB
VRLPKQLRFEGKDVRIRRQGNAVILEPVPTDWEWLKAVTGPFHPEFERAANEKPP